MPTSPRGDGAKAPRDKARITLEGVRADDDRVAAIRTILGNEDQNLVLVQWSDEAEPDLGGVVAVRSDAVAVAADNTQDALNRFEEASALIDKIAGPDESGLRVAERIFGEDIVGRVRPDTAFALPADLSRCLDAPVLTQTMLERARQAAYAEDDEPTPG